MVESGIGHRATGIDPVADPRFPVTRSGSVGPWGRRAVCGLALLPALAIAPGCANARGGRGAPWTIECLEATGPEQFQQLEAVAEALKRTPGIRSDEVFIHEHGDGVAGLYYGTYHRVREARTGKLTFPRQLRADVQLLRELGDESGQRYFLQAFPVRKPLPEVGNPAWALSNVEAKYTLQVAAFEPTEEFWDYKRAAAEYCAFLRREGYEAYYHHGRALSVVTVGAFGADAVLRDAAGRPYYSPEVRQLQEHELLKYNLVNGAIHRVRDDRGDFVAVPSRLVEVPGSAAAP